MPEKGFLERKTLSQVLESITLCQHCQHFFWMPDFPKTAAVSMSSNSSQSTLLLLPCPPKSPFKRRELGRSFRGYLAEFSPIYSLFHCHAFEKHTLNLQQKSGNIRMQRSTHVDWGPLKDLWIWRNRCFRELPYEFTACTMPYKTAVYDDYVIFVKTKPAANGLG